MASTGHSGSHSVQSMHSSGSITRKFGPSWKQSTGQTSTQSIYLHLMQLSVTTNSIDLPFDPLNVKTIVPYAPRIRANPASAPESDRLRVRARRAAGSGFQATAQLREMMILASRGAIRKVFAQGKLAARKRQFRPRNL